MEHPSVASVILDLAIGKTLDYSIPPLLQEKVKRGMHVSVPVRGHPRKGYIFALKEKSEFPKLQPISELLSEEKLVPDDLFELALWISRYYFAPMNQTLKMMLPASVRDNLSHKEQAFVRRAKTREELRKLCTSLQEKHPQQASVLETILPVQKGLLLTELLEKANVSRSPIDTLVKKGFLELDTIRIDRSPLVGAEYFKTDPKNLNEEQKAALDKVLKPLEEKRFETHLLHGITGSGKTEVYLQAIDAALALNRGTIMLVPEISLTAQTIERFRSRFEGHIAILHHRLSKGERFDEWHRIRRGEARIVIGARSALFSPVQNLGLIIVDEEHDGAYKQSDESPTYHARDAAVVRGKINEAVVILGSATPSLESFANTQKGKYHLSSLTTRPDDAQLPKVTIVDMKREFERAGGYTSFSEPLLDAIKERHARGEQAILFLNRRGYHTSYLCKGCGHVFECPHCEVALTFHLGENTLACHLCDHRRSPPPRSCPACKSDEPLKYRGVGTEQIERALHAVLPDVRTLRVDGDTTRHKGAHDRLFRDFRTGKGDVLIGTQMIAKGLHFPAVTLVAVLNSDAGLQIPDFRASERIFQLITQVSGRAGRGELPGEVIIQTQMPENRTLHLASEQDYATFFQEEIEVRRAFGYPPFSHLVKYTFSGEDPRKTQEEGNLFRKQMVGALGKEFLIHPLLPSGHPKIKDRYRFQFLVRGPHVLPINQMCEKLLAKSKLPSHIRLNIDVDPLSTFF